MNDIDMKSDCALVQILEVRTSHVVFCNRFVMFEDAGGVSWTDVGMDRFLRPALRVSLWGTRNVGMSLVAGVHIYTRCNLI